MPFAFAAGTRSQARREVQSVQDVTAVWPVGQTRVVKIVAVIVSET
jgi:hypothetical protein